MSRWFTLMTAFAVCALAASCGEETGGDDSGAQGTDPSVLAGRTLVVTDVTDAGQTHALVPGTQVRFTFDDGTMGITAGCNNLSGDYTLDGANLTVGPIGGTEMGCPEPRMAQDTWIAGLFESPVTVTADPLTFRSGDVVLSLADREDVSPDLPLAGTHWLLDGLGEGDGVSSVPGRAEASLRIDDQGGASVDTGCNSGRATAEVDDSTVTWGPLALTRRACADPGRQEVERAMVAVLDGETSYEINEMSLTITNGDRALMFRAG